MESGKLEELRHIARGIAAQFGPNCEVVVHDLSQHPDHTIVAIENGHVSGRWGTARPTWCWNGWSIRIRRHRITSAT